MVICLSLETNRIRVIIVSDTDSDITINLHKTSREHVFQKKAMTVQIDIHI